MKLPKKMPKRPQMLTEKNRDYGILIMLLLLSIPGIIYGGLPFVLTYGATIGMYLLCRALMPPIATPMFLCFSFHAGLLMFRLVGLISVAVQGEMYWALWLELLFSLLILVWLMWKPGLWPASVLLIFDALSFVTAFDAGYSIQWPVLLIRVAWPIAAVLSMFLGLYKLGVFSLPSPVRRNRKKVDLSQYILKAPKSPTQQNTQTRHDPVSEKKRKRRHS